jgi:hypothetical protein
VKIVGRSYQSATLELDPTDAERFANMADIAAGELDEDVAFYECARELFRLLAQELLADDQPGNRRRWPSVEPAHELAAD